MAAYGRIVAVAAAQLSSDISNCDCRCAKQDQTGPVFVSNNLPSGKLT